ncbi:MAG TPA: cupredoxin domain-containing protein [Candidatus Limnocylindrales bacterium]|jgi:plastocyanin|nr:cupredoxin domain-containing protein [Candidatus Limnocylindrales bacterium]
MRSLRSLAALLTVLAVAACTSAAPGWTYAPAPSATPVPSVEASGPAVASGEPSGSAAAGGIEITAQNVAYDKSELSAPADAPFQIVFHNQDASIQHNVAIHEGTPTGPEVFKGEIFPGVDTRTYDVPALKAGTYGFVCTVHPNMSGTLTAQ